MEKKMKSKLAIAGSFTVALAMAASLSVAPKISSVSAEFSNLYDSWEETLEAGAKLNVKLAGEGFTLLKNNGALPLAKEERNVTLLGTESYTIQSGGGGSGGLSRPSVDSASASASTIVTSLRDAGFNINPRVAAKYGNGNNTDTNTYMKIVESDGLVEFGGKQYAKADKGFLDGVDDNYQLYGDAAVLNFIRTGSEGYDNPAYTGGGKTVTGHADIHEHYQTLRDAERQLLAYAKYHKEVIGDISKIIVIINSPNVLEIGDIKDDDAIDSMLWIGTTGWNGADAVGKILTGEINPSGHLVDFWQRNLLDDPTYYNFSNDNQVGYLIDGNYGTIALGTSNTNAGNTLPINKQEGSTASGSGMMISYSEGLFAGYRYFESVAADLGDKGEAWYQSVTAYPFGFGLSYTTFDQEIVGVVGDLSNAAGQIEVKVKVTNKGSVAGKEVVQLYNTPEYHEGGIDKAHVNLVGFNKTNIIKPGKSETISVKIDVKDLAEFDYNDANKNDNNGYELEAGKYILSVRKNSHEAYDSTELTAGALLTWDEDGDPNTPNNIFSQTEGKWEMYNTMASHWTVSGKDHDLHRNTLLNAEKTGPSNLLDLAWGLTTDNVFKDSAFAVLAYRAQGNNSVTFDMDNATTLEAETDYENLWVKKAADMEGRTQASGVQDDNGLYPITVADLIGKDYDDPKWEQLLDQVTWAELTAFVRSGSYSTAALNTVGKPQTQDNDGPQQLKGRGNESRGNGWAWVSSPVLAATWNQELLYEQGKMVGYESQWQGGLAWYAPAMNNHRNPLSGRNFEYYSQDGMQGGLVAAAIVKGCTDVGGRVYIKHAICNDQETGRFGSCTFVNEQAFRQIYAKPFELSIRKGNANGIMAAFNDIGLNGTSSYALNIQLYTNEWGYRGETVTDYYMSQQTCGWYNQMMVRGCVFPLGNATQINSTWDADAKVVKTGGNADYTTWYWVRETAKRILYVHANSNTVKNGLLVSRAFNTANVAGQTYNALEAQIVDVEYLNTIFGVYGFDVTFTNLPEGLNYNANTGRISGTPAATANNQQVTVAVKGRYGLAWIQGSSSFRITITAGVAPVVASQVDLSVKEGALNTAFTGEMSQTAVTLTSSNYVPGGAGNSNNRDKYVSLVFEANGLPDGLVVAEDGAVTGAPTQVGTFNVELVATLGQCVREGSRNNYTYPIRYTSYTANIVFTVTGGFNVTIEDGFGNIALVKGVATDSTLDLSTIQTSDLQIPGFGMTLKGFVDANGDAVTSVNEAKTIYAEWNYPSVTIINGVWFLDGVNTGIQAAGQQGAQGAQGEAGAQGAAGINGKDGLDGLDGLDGIGIESANINEQGELVIVLSNGQSINLGKVVGADGQNGQDGANGQNGQDGAQGPAGPQGPAGADGAQGPAGPQGPAGENGSNGEAAQGGCGSVVGTTSVLVAAMSLLGAALLGLRIKRKAE